MAKKALALEGDWTNRSAFDLDEFDGSVFDPFVVIVVIVDDIDEGDDVNVDDDEVDVDDDDEGDVDVGAPTILSDIEVSPLATSSWSPRLLL